MGRMVRKQVYIAAEHEALLKRRAAELGVSEAELIRRGIEALGRRLAPRLPDRRAWQDELEFIRERAKLPSTGTGRTWRREDAYDERGSSVSR